MHMMLYALMSYSGCTGSGCCEVQIAIPAVCADADANSQPAQLSGQAAVDCGQLLRCRMWWHPHAGVCVSWTRALADYYAHATVATSAAAVAAAVNASTQVWSNGLQQALDDAFASPCPPSSITLAGHSFGGVGVTMLAPRVTRYVQQKTAAQQAPSPRKVLPLKLLLPGHQSQQVQPPAIAAVIFGAPPVSDAVYAAYFNRMVNIRRLEFELDPYNVLFIAFRPVPGIQLDPRFARVGGIIRWGPAAMPFQQQQWSKLAGFTQGSPVLQQSLTRATGQAIPGWNVWSSATHTCSYM
jgi:hypothetical protein